MFGSGGSTGDDQTIIVDLDGAVKAIKASEQIDHQHFIIWYILNLHVLSSHPHNV
jgi:ribosomal protein L27